MQRFSTLRHVARKLPAAAVVLALASAGVFAIIRLAPGDPATSLAGPDAAPEAVAAIRASLGLDRSPLEQYFSWLADAAALDFGTSYTQGEPVAALLLSAAGNTAILAGAALGLATLSALALSIAAAAWPNRWLSAAVSAFTTFGVAVPTFVTGVGLVLLFGVLVPILPAGGLPPSGFTSRLDIAAQYTLMPAVCLALPTAAVLTRFLTAGLRAELAKPHAEMAVTLGFSRLHLACRGALRASLPPVTTVFGGQVGSLLGGAILVESIFAWPGLGSLLEQGVGRRDYPVVQALLLVSLAVFILASLAADAATAALDPRVRLEARS
jgi:peptide/nickel transport system permease protein